MSRRGRLAKHAGPGQEESQRTLKIKDVHDDCSAAEPRNAAQGRSASAGFCASGLDRHSTAVIGPGGGWSAGSAVLSRPLVTLLSPPVGGISQALQSYSCRRCQLGGCFRGCPGEVGGGSAATSTTVLDSLRQGTSRRAGMGHLQPEGKRRYCQTSGIHPGAGSDCTLRLGRWG